MHDARRCQHPCIEESRRTIYQMLNTDCNNPAVRQFALNMRRTSRTMPFWKRVWKSMIQNLPSSFGIAQRQFILSNPATVQEVKSLFWDWAYGRFSRLQVTPPNQINVRPPAPVTTITITNTVHSPRSPTIPPPDLHRNRNQPQKITLEMQQNGTKYFQDTDCPICMKTINPKNSVAYNCKHTICVSCVIKHIVKCKSTTCHICRVPVKKVHFTSEINPNNFNILYNHLTTL